MKNVARRVVSLALSWALGRGMMQNLPLHSNRDAEQFLFNFLFPLSLRGAAAIGLGVK
jgi:hypothetical protein